MTALPRLLLLAALALTALAATPYRVADLRTYRECCDAVTPPRYVGTFGVRAFVLTGEVDAPLTLWSTDGTEAGTARLFEHFTGAAANPENFVAGKDGLYFAADGKLWRTDGTVAGTVIVASPPFVARPLLEHNGAMLFLADRGNELWAWDAFGARSVGRFAAAEWVDAASAGDVVYIATAEGLWRGDGRTLGTKLLPLPAWKPVWANDRLYFIARSEEDGAELWTSDGTVAGTRFIRNIRRGQGSTFARETTSMAAVGDRVLFVTDLGELGVSDSTANGTYLLRLGRPNQLVSFVTLHGKALFLYDSTAAGRQLWTSDGTPAGTHMVRADWDLVKHPALEPIALGATRMYYYDTVPGRARPELFQTDGTQDGTLPVHRAGTPRAFVRGLAGNLVTIGDVVFFSAGEAEHGIEPWVSDGTEAGTRRIADLVADSTGSSDPDLLVAGEDRLYFRATSDAGPAIWSTDGTATGTSPILENDNINRLLRPFIAVGNTLYLLSDSQLWRSEGRSAPALVHQFGFRDSKPPLGTVVDGRLYLARYWDGLLATDGTREGTKTIDPDPHEGVASFAGQPWFTTSSGWVSTTDGTPEGTRAVATVYPRNQLHQPVPFGGALIVFDAPAAAPAAHGVGVWMLSGAPADATLVKEIERGRLPFAGSTVPSASIGTALLFTIWRGRHELWRTDGTSEGTTFVRDWATDAQKSVQGMVALGDRAIFAIDDGFHGLEPWVSDGTRRTRMLRDVLSGPDASMTGSIRFVVAAGLAWFVADDGEHGRELWQTDGTPEGTLLVADLREGPESSSPAEITRMGDTLYFAATTDDGRELWALPLPDDPAAITIDDARASENASHASIPVRLSVASRNRVTVDYETADASAIAARDYLPSSGRLVFEPGQTLQHIEVPLIDNAAPGLPRSLWVKLSNANARLERVAASAVIEDDDVRADLSLTLGANAFGHWWTVRNAGPSTASNIRLCFEGSCLAFPPLAPGGFVESSGLFADVTPGAKVTLHEPDPDPSNNVVHADASEDRRVYAAPSVLREGETGTLTLFDESPAAHVIRLTSSDPTVVSITERAGVPANRESIALLYTAHELGTATITVTLQDGRTQSVNVRVLPAGVPIRAEAVLSLSASGEYATELVARVDGLTPDGARPTGQLTISVDGTFVATVPVVNGESRATGPELAPGTHTATLVYSGDANFANGSAGVALAVEKRDAHVTAMRIGESTEVIVRVRGLRPPPTGVAIVSGDAHPLAVVDTITSSATVSAPLDARTIAIDYPGDANYLPAHVTIPIETSSGRRRRGP
jgi:ELWxxDGT repeat protein